MILRSKAFWSFHVIFWVLAAFAITLAGSSGLPLAGGVTRGLLQGAAGFGLSLGLLAVHERVEVRDLNHLALMAVATCAALGFIGTVATNPVVWATQGVPLAKLKWSYYTHSWLVMALLLLVWTGFYLAHQSRLSFARGATDDQAADAVRSLTAATTHPRHVAVESRAAILLLPVEAILAVRAAGDYIELVTADATYLRRETLTDMSARLDPSRFVRVHRSAVVNLDAVERLTPQGRGDYDVWLQGGAKVRLSRRYREALAERVQIAL